MLKRIDTSLRAYKGDILASFDYFYIVVIVDINASKTLHLKTRGEFMNDTFFNACMPMVLDRKEYNRLKEKAEKYDQLVEITTEPCTTTRLIPYGFSRGSLTKDDEEEEEEEEEITLHTVRGKLVKQINESLQGEEDPNQLDTLADALYTLSKL